MSSLIFPVPLLYFRRWFIMVMAYGASVITQISISICGLSGVCLCCS